MSKWYSKGLPVASVSFLDNNRPCGSTAVQGELVASVGVGKDLKDRDRAKCPRRP